MYIIEFVSQVMKHPQKLAVELDDQSLTYSELLHYAQLLSLNSVGHFIILFVVKLFVNVCNEVYQW